RGAAWDLREIAEAAYINPDHTPMRRYFTRMVTNNMSFLLHKLPLWQAREGSAYGYLPGAYGDGAAMPPWQQDFFAMSMGTLALEQIPGARRVLHWQTHFLANSLLPLATGFNPHDGIAYNLIVYNPATKQFFASWAAIRRATERGGQANGTGWAHSQGYYAQTRLAALASIINTIPSARARAAYHWLTQAHAPETSPLAHANQAQFWITPEDTP
ncbi:MAG: hypothetical protein POH28_13250, partial [Acidocella sp.]|nr:hypothetical protein [Acidocella sp.]